MIAAAIKIIATMPEDRVRNQSTSLMALVHHLKERECRRRGKNLVRIGVIADEASSFAALKGEESRPEVPRYGCRR